MWHHSTVTCYGSKHHHRCSLFTVRDRRDFRRTVRDHPIVCDDQVPRPRRISFVHEHLEFAACVSQMVEELGTSFGPGGPGPLSEDAAVPPHIDFIPRSSFTTLPSVPLLTLRFFASLVMGVDGFLSTASLSLATR